MMQYLEQDLGWHYRIGSRMTCGCCNQENTVSTEISTWRCHITSGCKITKSNPYGQVNLALARDPISRELWYIVSDEPPSLQTFREYGERFDIESNFLDEKSNGFQLEQSLVTHCFISFVFGSGNRHYFNCSRTTGCASR